MNIFASLSRRLFASMCLFALTLTASAQRWSEQKANDWYAQQPWLVGANYIPSNAINQLEMFQATTFDPAINDRELGYAEGIGMNVMRVFLQDQLWQQDPDGFKQRLNTFLSIAAKHHIKILFVLFDSCWDPNPKLGPQHPPIPGVHNSGWVQSPGIPRLLDRSVEPQLKAYVIGVVSAFANDPRVLGWDLWNEPDNDGGGDNSRSPAAVKAKFDRIAELLPQVFAWARSAHPSQPLTTPLWQGDWHDPAKEDPIVKIQLRESDIITFHNYGWPEDFAARVHELEPLHRPILCSEYMARGAGSTFDGTLPVAKRLHVAAINWGLVNGKTQTNLPWDSWQRPYVLEQPPIWFHDVFHPNGTPYRQAEADLIRRLTGRGTPPTTPTN
ncbi:cellulase family glycosylhydrolase [Granulicella sp. 5B5]|uniref:cellulase family glycosylhydrolase n=1 Tax=Granulicella sp. 5B5 TaxID=1617967 RepID=UPI0015F71F62|nr:cellulase family glycosylhydrolase [Granulicella sp. 5B5]QMV19296.1 cellulase family glycosylhydrolase [Granulicella sp. 5B5]